MKMTDEQFEHEFEQLQASWAFEDQELSEIEKEQLRRVCTGEIQKADYDQWILDVLKNKSSNQRN
ncbi:hypothetical protein [Paenibacillus odorifer]|uniref:hypothetical protein n=1 Tax=Paenibacillus odorifer TaxID=189426 RepID=UPI00096C2F85|nr:hypothetical protein [Paenibacillus odorifer]OMD08201.1 hypothetical protein BJP47_30065 [Paenibacillus odorifer]